MCIPESELPAVYLTSGEEQVTTSEMRSWLCVHVLAEGLRDDDHVARRYKILRPVELPEVPEEERDACLRDLLEFEDSFAITKAEFG